MMTTSCPSIIDEDIEAVPNAVTWWVFPEIVTGLAGDWLALWPPASLEVYKHCLGDMGICQNHLGSLLNPASDL